MVLPGPVVTMAGEGPQLAVVYHRSPPVGDCQVMACMLLHVAPSGMPRVVCQVDLPLPLGSQLSWLGFSTTNVSSLWSAGVCCVV